MYVIQLSIIIMLCVFGITGYFHAILPNYISITQFWSWY